MSRVVSEVAALDAIAKAVAVRGCDCILNAHPHDAPKAYAVHQPSRTSGPREICYVNGQFDVWRSTDGRLPTVVRTNITADEAVRVIAEDYSRLKARFLRTRHQMKKDGEVAE